MSCGWVVGALDTAATFASVVAIMWTAEECVIWVTAMPDMVVMTGMVGMDCFVVTRMAIPFPLAIPLPGFALPFMPPLAILVVVVVMVVVIVEMVSDLSSVLVATIGAGFFTGTAPPFDS